MKKIQEYILTFCSLFASISTILCCALPIILVSIGMGAVFASLTANIPAISYLSSKSVYLFVISAIFLALSGYFIFKGSNNCPIDKKLGEICQKSKKFNKIVWYLSLLILLISIFFKYLLIHLI